MIQVKDIKKRLLEGKEDIGEYEIVIEGLQRITKIARDIKNKEIVIYLDDPILNIINERIKK